MRRTFRFGLRLGILVGVAAAVTKLIRGRRRPPEPVPINTPPPTMVSTPAGETVSASTGAVSTVTAGGVAGTAGTAATADLGDVGDVVQATDAATELADAADAVTDLPGPPWVESLGAVCPPSHPVKAQLSTGRYHLPGTAGYEDVEPDRCYLDEPAAEADGLTRAEQ